MAQNGAPIKRRKRPRTPLERTLSLPLSYPFITSMAVLPGSVLVLIGMVNLIIGEHRWPPEYGSVDMCVVYVNAANRLQVIENSAEKGFDAFQESLLARMKENATFVLPFARQGQAVASYNGRFEYRVLTPEGEEPQAIRATCDHTSSRRIITTYEVSPDLLLPVSYFIGVSPLTITLWTYPFTMLVVLPVLFFAGRRTRRRMSRREKRHREEMKERAAAGQDDPSAQEQVTKKKRRRRRRKRRSE